ncbi:MAG: hypothetical protein ABTD50_22245 [Polyangiaceae bacterium]|jgi:hypothetical protein
MKKPSARLLGLSLVLAGSLQFGAPSLVFAQEPHSAADIAQGREFFGEGLALRDKGDIAGALEKFKAAHALAGTPISGLELGRAYVAMNKTHRGSRNASLRGSDCAPSGGNCKVRGGADRERAARRRAQVAYSAAHRESDWRNP